MVSPSSSDPLHLLLGIESRNHDSVIQFYVILGINGDENHEIMFLRPWPSMYEVMYFSVDNSNTHPRNLSTWQRCHQIMFLKLFDYPFSWQKYKYMFLSNNPCRFGAKRWCLLRYGECFGFIQNVHLMTVNQTENHEIMFL